MPRALHDGPHLQVDNDNKHVRYVFPYIIDYFSC